MDIYYTIEAFDAKTKNWIQFDRLFETLTSVKRAKKLTQESYAKVAGSYKRFRIIKYIKIKQVIK